MSALISSEIFEAINIDSDPCEGGSGTAVNYGIDDNNDGILDTEEIDGTFYICDSDDGTNGQDGING